jgi:DNA replication protein DnaC
MCKIPKRYAGVNIENSECSKKEVELVENALKNRQSLLLTGRVGSGKTHLAALVYNLCGESTSRAWFDVSEYIFEMNRRMKLRTTDAASVLQSFWDIAIYRSLVVFDDLGAEEDSQANVSVLNRILMDRYNNQRWTIITTNLDGSALKNRYGSRIISRIYEDFVVVVANGRDRRKEKLKEVIEI